jgi:hypothetical protein
VQNPSKDSPPAGSSSLLLPFPLPFSPLPNTHTWSRYNTITSRLDSAHLHLQNNYLLASLGKIFKLP